MNDPLNRTFETVAGDPPPAFLEAVASRRRRRRATQVTGLIGVLALGVVAVLQIPSGTASVTPLPVAMIDTLPIGVVDDGSVAFGLGHVPRLGEGLGVGSADGLTDPF